MARTCTICSHEGRDDIDLALVSGQSQRTVAAAFRVSHDAVRRHASNHLTAGLRLAAEQWQMTRLQDLSIAMVALVEEAQQALDRAKVGGDERLVLGAIKELRATLQAVAQIMPEHDDQDVRDLVVALGRTLPHHPAAARMLATELDSLGAADAADVIRSALHPT